MDESGLQGADQGSTPAVPRRVPLADSRTDHQFALVKTAVAAVVLVAATAFAQSSQHSAPSIEPALKGGSVELITADDTDYSEYPGGAGGTSNGHLSAAQEGEPLGAAGTSGGSTGPIARTHGR